MKLFPHLIFTCLGVFLFSTLVGQNILLQGRVQDEHTKEAVAFSSLRLSLSRLGRAADSAGVFMLNIPPVDKDTLVVSSVGYETLMLPLSKIFKDSNLVINLRHTVSKSDVIVKTKINRGLFLWQKIMSKKDQYNRYNQTNFAYEAYNKLEIDLRNIDVEKVKKNPLVKPYAFIFEQMDTSSEDRPFLPAFLVETLSDYAYQKKPEKFRENIKAALTPQIDNESIQKMLGVMNQNVNIYSNFITVMDKKFISPFYENADNFYRFNVADTQVVGGEKIFHFVFAPKAKGMSAFNGDAWVSAGDFRIRRISMYLGAEANINYLERVSIFQEFEPLGDSIYFVSRDKFIADFNIAGKNSLSFTGRKTTSYRNIVINSDSVKNIFLQQNTQELITNTAGGSSAMDADWAKLRHDSLSANEKKIYDNINRLDTMPEFHQLQTTLRFLGTGYKSYGNLEIGPWFNWISGNNYEGTRLRFDLGTNYAFNKNIYIHGYGAYGFKDKAFKGMAEAFWITKRDTGYTRLHIAYTNDIDNGISQLGAVSQDNIFTLAIRKPHTLQRFLFLKDLRFEVFKEWGQGFSTELFLAHREFTPLLNLPLLTGAKAGGSMKNFELAMKLRFAYLEQFLQPEFFRYSLGTRYPIAELVFARSFKGMAGSDYDYTKLSFSVRDNLKMSPYGDLSLKLQAGKVFGTAPYPFLEIHPGNNLFYFDPAAYNLMTRFEYLSDQYAGINLEHHFGSGIFRYIPITRKMKLRQFWTAKYLVGGLSAANNTLNNKDSYFKTLNHAWYGEAGTGIDNIFRFFRLDLVWRLSPDIALPPQNAGSSFAVFGSFSLKF